jgi:hypothetical protein
METWSQRIKVFLVEKLTEKPLFLRPRQIFKEKYFSGNNIF